MRISEWLAVAKTVSTYKQLLAFGAYHDLLGPRSKLAYFKVFHFHPHQDPDKVVALASEFVLDPSHPVARRVARRVSESETVPARTLVEIPADGACQEIPMLDVWEGFGEISIVVRRHVSFR